MTHSSHKLCVLTLKHMNIRNVYAHIKYNYIYILYSYLCALCANYAMYYDTCTDLEQRLPFSSRAEWCWIYCVCLCMNMWYCIWWTTPFPEFFEGQLIELMVGNHCRTPPQFMVKTPMFPAKISGFLKRTHWSPLYYLDHSWSTKFKLLLFPFVG